MKNTTINLGVIRKVAEALGEINERVVYVGGAVVSLYINDPAAALNFIVIWMSKYILAGTVFHGINLILFLAIYQAMHQREYSLFRKNKIRSNFSNSKFI